MPAVHTRDSCIRVYQYIDLDMTSKFPQLCSTYSWFIQSMTSSSQFWEAKEKEVLAHNGTDDVDPQTKRGH
jgi:hypothetical protein